MKRFTLLLVIQIYSVSCTQFPVEYTAEFQPEKMLSSQEAVVNDRPPAVPSVSAKEFSLPAIPENDAEELTMNISVHDIDAREFFMGLVIDTDINMLIHPEVEGVISLELKNVSISQVLDAVQKVYGYDFKKTEIGYIVYPATLQTKIFKLNRLDLTRVGETNTQVSSGQTPGSENDSNSSSTDSNDSSPISPEKISSYILTRTETDFWDECNSALNTIISIDPEASVVMNRQTGVIVVRAKPRQLREIENFIELTQNQISRQVILEAKIIEIILDDSHQAGINWQSVVREAVNSAPVLTGVGAIGTSFRDIFTVGGRWGDFGAYLELLETQGKTNILSSPRIATLNNQKAIIKVGSDEFFITKVSSDTQNNGGSFDNISQTQDITFTPFFSGIALDVTPQINDDEEITLHIHPSITRVESQTKTFTINGENGSLPLALNTIRESDSIIKARNGQIVVIGGLMQETVSQSDRGVAGLSQIPYLGNLFRVNTGKMQKSELVILLRPTIIKSGQDWLPMMQQSQQQYQHLNSLPRWK